MSGTSSVCRRASLKGPEAGDGLEKCWRQTRGEGRVLRSGSAGEVQGRDYWSSRCAGMCSENRWTQAVEATKDLPHGLDQGICSTSAQAN